MQLSFVLPFTRQELVGSLQGWRQDPDKCADLRYELLLKSFLRYFRKSDLGEFIILCPLRDCNRSEALLRAITDDNRFKVIPEDHVLAVTRDAGNADLEGWYVQQILKMGIARDVSSAFYLTLDSDVVCMRPFGSEDLIIDNGSNDAKALVNLETRADYATLYKAPFAEKEVGIKEQRYSLSAEVLGYDRLATHRGHYYGETPCVIHTGTMRSLLDQIELRHQQPWRDALAANVGWSEYGLYFQFCEMSKSFHTLYYLTHCNHVLDLKSSVWQENEWYRESRPYDKAHFNSAGTSGATGLFVAIQSWLSLRSWLPERYRTLGEFYEDLSSWVLGDSTVRTDHAEQGLSEL